MAEFSHITQEKPIPETSLKVVFRFPNGSADLKDLSFQFEHEDFVHKLGQSVKAYQLEEFICMQLKYKEQNRQRYFLATSFEATRVSDPRIKLLQEKHETPQPTPERLFI